MEFNNIRLDKAGSEPLYRQLAHQLKEALRRGELRDGERLPPIRAWKEALGVSPVTATQAYEVLAEEGYTSGQVGRGTFIHLPVENAPTPHQLRENTPVYTQPGSQPANRRELPAYLEFGRAAQVQRYLQTALARYRISQSGADDMIIMTSGSPSPELFALGRWKAAMTKAGESFERESLAGEEGNQQFQYGPALGDHPTREWLSDYLTRFGFRPAPDEIMLTTGTQQALDMLARVFVGPGDPVLVESPTYIAAQEIFESRGVHWLPIPLETGGLNLDLLERQAERQRPRLLYLVPTSQNPSGQTMSIAQRRRLLDLAGRYDFFILEDDTCNELFYGEETPPTLKSLDTAGRVIYLKSFSKLIFPAVRLGLIVAPEGVLERLAYAKALFDRSTSLPVARAVLKFAGHPAFEREMAEARAFYRQRRDILREGFERELAGSGWQWSDCQGGFSFLVSLPRGLTAEEFHLAAAEQGVAVAPGPVFYPLRGEAPTNTLRISFGDNRPDRLQEASRRLSRALQTLQERPRSAAPGSQFTLTV